MEAGITDTQWLLPPGAHGTGEEADSEAVACVGEKSS